MRVTTFDGGAAREMSLDELSGVFSEEPHALNAKESLTEQCNFTRSHREGWFGEGEDALHSTYDSERMLRHGWYNGVRRVLALKSEVELPPVRDRRRRLTRGDEGDELCIDRAIRGDWDTAWTRARREMVNAPATVDMVAMIGGNNTRSADELFWGGATALVLCDALEAAGYGVNLLGVSASQTGGGLAINVVEIKPPDEPMRPDVVASVLCHAGVFRSHIFHSRLTLPVAVDCGFGSTRSLPESEPYLRQCGVIRDGAILLDHTYSLLACKAQIARVIEQLTSGG